MENIIKRWRPLAALTIAVIAGVTYATVQATAATAAAPRLTATQISDGVLFNEGTATEYLTKLRRGPTKWTSTLREIQASINRTIQADPRWSDTFVRNMQSGDPRSVDVGLTDLGKLARAELERRYGRANVDRAVTQLDKDWVDEKLAQAAVLDMEYAYNVGADTWFETDTVVYKNEALAIDTVAIVDTMYLFTEVVTKGSDHLQFGVRTQLASEVLVKDVAAGLKTAGV